MWTRLQVTQRVGATSCSHVCLIVLFTFDLLVTYFFSFFQHLDFPFPALWCLSTLYWPPSVCMFAIYKMCVCVRVPVCPAAQRDQHW